MMICILVAWVMTGCLKDEGNYNYAEVSAPTWLFEPAEQIYIYQGDSVKYKSAFRFEKDSAERLANVRYEWTLNGVVLSEERNLWMSGDSIIKKLNLTEYPDGFMEGFFNVVEKSTGVKYMCKRLFNIYPRYSRGTWLILSENGTDSRLSCQLKKLGGESNQASYETIQDVYKQLNGNDIPGHPRRMIWHEARNISPSVGAMTIVTDKVAYELNCETLQKTGELQDQFQDGTPADFKVSDVYYSGIMSFIATEDGRLFRRMMADSWLGGKYLTEPYVVDGKGAEVRRFGHGAIPWNGMGFPCYDEKNGRVMMINFDRPKGKIYPVTPDGGEHTLKVWAMDKDVDILRLCTMKDLDGIDYYSNDLCLMIYNQNGKTYMHNFILNTNPPYNYAYCMSDTQEPKLFPGGNLDHETIFLTTIDESAKWYGGVPLYRYLLYTRGNQLRYLDKDNDMDYPIITFEAKVTAARYAAYSESYGAQPYNEIAVGLENGDFMIVNINDISAAYIIKASKVNVSGAVREIAQISIPNIPDYY